MILDSLYEINFSLLLSKKKKKPLVCLVLIHKINLSLVSFNKFI